MPAPDPTDDPRPGTSAGSTRARLAAVAAEALPGDRVVEVAALPGEGPHDVAAVTTAGGERFVLKCALDGADATALRREAAVTTTVGRRTDVPVAEVVAADVAPRPDRSTPPYLLFQWVEGQPLEAALQVAPPPVHGALFRELGETMARLHEGLAFDGPGTVVPSDAESFEVSPAGPWPEVVAGELADHVEALGGTRFEGLAEDCWDGLVDGLPRLDTGEPFALLHGDVGDGNAVFDGPALAGLLDWERATVGHPEYDLCRAEVRCFWNRWGAPDPLAAAMRAGYVARRPLAPGFEARRPTYLVVFYLLSLGQFGSWVPSAGADRDAFAGRVEAKVRGLLDAALDPD